MEVNNKTYCPQDIMELEAALAEKPLRSEADAMLIESLDAQIVEMKTHREQFEAAADRAIKTLQVRIEYLDEILTQRHRKADKQAERIEKLEAEKKALREAASRYLYDITASTKNRKLLEELLETNQINWSSKWIR